MASIFDVAKYILHKKGEMSTWKLQKLCYYCQAWSLAWTGKELFPEDFEDWANGAVCPELFRIHKGRFTISEDDLVRGDISVFTSDEKETMDIVIRDYGDLEPYELREINHSEKPWKQTRGNLEENAPDNKIISKSLMGEYYASL